MSRFFTPSVKHSCDAFGRGNLVISADPDVMKKVSAQDLLSLASEKKTPEENQFPQQFSFTPCGLIKMKHSFSTSDITILRNRTEAGSRSLLAESWLCLFLFVFFFLEICRNANKKNSPPNTPAQDQQPRTCPTVETNREQSLTCWVWFKGPGSHSKAVFTPNLY